MGRAYWSGFKQTLKEKENEQGSGAADPAEEVDTATSRGHAGAAEEEAKTETEKVDAAASTTPGAAEGNVDITASMAPDDAAEKEFWNEVKRQKAMFDAKNKEQGSHSTTACSSCGAAPTHESPASSLCGSSVPSSEDGSEETEETETENLDTESESSAAAGEEA